MELQWMEQFRFKCFSSTLRRTPAAVALEAVPRAKDVERQRWFTILLYDRPSGCGKNHTCRSVVWL